MHAATPRIGARSDTPLLSAHRKTQQTPAQAAKHITQALDAMMWRDIVGLQEITTDPPSRSL